MKKYRKELIDFIDQSQKSDYLKNLPFKSKINGNILTVTYKNFKVVKIISIPEIINIRKENIFENETLKSAKQLNIMMFGKKNYSSKEGIIPKQLRKDSDSGNIYTLYFKRPVSGEIQKYRIKYVIGISEGIEFIKEDGKKDISYGQLIFIEPKYEYE